MARYVAFLRGISPQNSKMSELKGCFEAAGFSDVATVLGTGNVVFSAASAPLARLERKAEQAMQDGLGRAFATMVRSVGALQALLATDPYAMFDVPPDAKRVVSFLRAPPSVAPLLPIERDGARIVAVHGSEVFTFYVVSPRGPVFMTLIERSFGADVTTRTWDTVRKCVTAALRTA